MPAAVDDPAGPTIHRVSGQPPFPDPSQPLLLLPADILPRRVTLRDRQTVATILPVVAAARQVPASLVTYLCGQINREIEGGDTYPMTEPFTPSGFAAHWFQSFGAVMLLGDFASADDVPESRDWARDCLGSFYIRPNYPGRSSHVCNGGLLVTDASRNRGVGRLMGESYIDWAPRLGYTYSVFNLVYETNVASCRIWDSLGFKRIGRVKGCGRLRSHPDRLVDAIIYGRDLPPPRVLGGPGGGGGGGADGDGDDGGGGSGGLVVGEERFDKIRYYLKYGRYPSGADRAEKSRLRSAATHYKLLGDGDTLMLKDKLVVSDPGRQYEIARATHGEHHGGINKTTAIIAEKYHWSRIKETVSDVIRLCAECKELSKTATTPVGGGGGGGGGGGAAAAVVVVSGAQQARIGKATTTPAVAAGVKRSRSPSPERGGASASPSSSSSLARPSSPPRSVPAQSRHAAGGDAAHGSSGSSGGRRVFGLRSHHASNSTLLLSSSTLGPSYADPRDFSIVQPSQTLRGGGGGDTLPSLSSSLFPYRSTLDDDDDDGGGGGHVHRQSGGSAGRGLEEPDVYQPIDPQIMNHDHHDHDQHGEGGHGDDGMHAFDSYHRQHSDFQALLHATEDDDNGSGGGGGGGGGGGSGTVGQEESDRAAAAAAAAEAAAVDRDLEMLIRHGAEDEDEDEETGDGDDGGGGGLGKAKTGVGVGGGGGQADAEMDDLEDSVLRDGQWT